MKKRNEGSSKNFKKISIEKRLLSKMKETENESFQIKKSMGYIDKSKPVREFYVRLFILFALVIFFSVNMFFSFYRYTSIPDPNYFLTTMDGKLHQIDPLIMSKEQLIAIKKEYEKENEKKQ